MFWNLDYKIHNFPEPKGKSLNNDIIQIVAKHSNTCVNVFHSSQIIFSPLIKEFFIFTILHLLL